MKIFFRLILIFLLTFFSLGISNCRAEYNVATLNQMVLSTGSEKVIFTTVPDNDTAIASANNTGYELFALKSGSDNGNFSLENGLADNRDYAQQFKVYLNKIMNSKSHNISSYLKNEICTRAP